MFRFSLRTLVLVSLWCGAAMWVWRTREPWVLVDTREIKTTERPNWGADDRVRAEAPDGQRAARAEFTFVEVFPGIVTPPGSISILDRSNNRRLLSFKVGFHIYEVEFLDDDTLLCKDDYQQSTTTEGDVLYYLRHWTYHRRFPEWWWGNLLRPEVWVLIVLSLVLGATFVRNARWGFKRARPFAERKATM